VSSEQFAGKCLIAVPFTRYGDNKTRGMNVSNIIENKNVNGLF
jgi:hypothetical protein